jgi:cytochrome c553
VPIKASSGHWTITKLFLDFAKNRSVATHSIGITAPPLDDPLLVLKGAGQYDYACRPCHGSPSFDQPRVAGAMTPTPPDLRQSVREFDDPELFYIVKHGIKLTGMPAWPAQRRDDEVWAMVAFLRRLPGLDARAYDALASGPVEESPRPPIEELAPPARVPEAVTDSCARCHGVDGRGRGTGAFPILAGQHAAYLRASLDAYLKGERHSGIMEPVAAALGPDEMQEIAEYYSGLEAGPVPGERRGDANLDRGRQIAQTGLPDKLVPACLSCHGEHDIRRNPHYPTLAGQYPEYLRLQLTLFRDRTRGGTPYHHIMRRVATQLSDEEIRDVAAYLASLPAPGRR